MLTAHTDDAHYDRVIDILDDEGAVDMDERETQWRSEGRSRRTPTGARNSSRNRAGGFGAKNINCGHSFGARNCVAVAAAGGGDNSKAWSGMPRVLGGSNLAIFRKTASARRAPAASIGHLANFSSESYPASDRIEAWGEAMRALSLSVDPCLADPNFFGSIVSCVSPHDFVFARMSSCPQRIDVVRQDALFICLHLDGEGVAANGQLLSAYDILYAPAAAAFTSRFTSDFRQLLVRAPRDAVRTQGTHASNVVHVRGRTGLGYLFSRFLSSVADSIETITTEDLRPVEQTVSTFLVSLLAQQTPDVSLPLGAAGRNSLIQRICEDVEARMNNPDLSLADVAAVHNVSTRYLQKLFENAGESFTHYLRQRRLERCRADLIDPTHAALSISQIGFNWGFSDAAHFSRSFRDRFGSSPRSYRQEAANRAPVLVARQLSRGWPSKALETGVRVRTHPGRADATKASAGAAETTARYHLAATAESVHWGFFSRALAPVLEVASGAVVTVEVLTQHAYDDYDRMIKGDTGLESVFHWTKSQKNIDRRGAGPMDASVYGRGAGEGFGVHIMTGPIAITGASPGDVLEVRILDVLPRPSRNEAYAGRCFGSNAATFWGYHYDDLLTEPRLREVVTLYEFDLGKERPCACAVYSYRWTPQTDPFGTVHPTIDYPGVPVDHSSVEKRYDVLEGVTIPVRPHFGVIGVAPRESELIDSVPPAYFGGNIDNWRAGKGAKIYLPVSVPGALLSIGDPHASQGDAEVCGTAIECSLTGIIQVVLHKKGEFDHKPFADLSAPIIETPTEWVLLGFSHPNYLSELGDKAQSKVYETASLDLAMKDAFRKMRRFLMTARRLSEDEALSLMSVGVDFGISQVVDGNWGVHAILRKELFDDERSGS